MTGRAQLDDLRRRLTSHPHPVDRVVVLACDRGAAALAPALAAAGAECRAVACAGNLHTSVIEHAIRAGAPGVLVLSCPPRDCWGREGPRWLHERLYHDREAELQPRVDRRRVRVAYVNAVERRGRRGAQAFQEGLAAVMAVAADEAVKADEAVCRPVPLAETEAAQ
jgi:coenzyme F420-reducing hydrogenase delta subunit